MRKAQLRQLDKALPAWLAACASLLLAAPAPAAAPCTTTTIGTRTYRLELATTPAARERGLMRRTHIGPCDGMAFFFPSVAPHRFWMKNTLIPLDILFVDVHRRVVAIVAATPHSETPLGPDTPIASAIEIDGGRAARDGITVGDRVTYETQVDGTSEIFQE